MSKIFAGQTKLTIQLDVNTNIADASGALISYRKPSGVLGSFTAVITDAVKGIIQYVIENPTDINETGDWRFWAKINYVDGKTISGVATVITVFQEGTV